MTTSDWLSFLAIIIALASALFTWGKYKVSKESLKWKKYDTRLFEKRFAPHLNIEIMFKTRTFKHPERKMEEIVIYIDNSGDSPANFPEWGWVLILKNGDCYRGRWRSFIGEQHVRGKRSYIDAKSTLQSAYDRFIMKNPQEELKNLDKWYIWMRYVDNLNRRWKTYTIFKEEVNGRWKAKSTKVYQI